MSRKENPRIDTSGGSGLGASPFAALSGLDAAALPQPKPTAQMKDAQRTNAPAAAEGAAKRGRVDLRWEKSGRGGKVVTLIGGTGLASASAAELDQLLQLLKSRFGCGGTRSGQVLELQGKRVEQVEPLLAQMGFRVVRTGG